MRKSLLPKALLWTCLTAFVFTSCVNDDYLVAAKPTPDQSFTEEFDTVSAAYNRGWKTKNTSDPTLSLLWQQGGDVAVPFFPAYSSNTSNVGFIGCSAFVTPITTIGSLSNWLFSPVLTMQNGDTISFYTRAQLYDDGLVTTGTASGVMTDYGNRLQLRLNSNNEGTEVGVGAEFGDFTTALLDINPNYVVFDNTAPDPMAYPSSWTRFQAIVYGLKKPTSGRFAFHYLIEDGTNNGSGVGIDLVSYKSVKK